MLRSASILCLLGTTAVYGADFSAAYKAVMAASSNSEIFGNEDVAKQINQIQSVSEDLKSFETWFGGLTESQKDDCDIEMLAATGILLDSSKWTTEISDRAFDWAFQKGEKEEAEKWIRGLRLCYEAVEGEGYSMGNKLKTLLDSHIKTQTSAVIDFTEYVKAVVKEVTGESNWDKFMGLKDSSSLETAKQIKYAQMVYAGLFEDENKKTTSMSVPNQLKAAKALLKADALASKSADVDGLSTRDALQKFFNRYHIMALLTKNDLAQFAGVFDIEQNKVWKAMAYSDDDQQYKRNRMGQFSDELVKLRALSVDQSSVNDASSFLGFTVAMVLGMMLLV